MDLLGDILVINPPHGDPMQDIILKLILNYLTDENLRKMIEPIKADLMAKLEASAKASPEVYDDVLVRALKVLLGM